MWVKLDFYSFLALKCIVELVDFYKFLAYVKSTFYFKSFIGSSSLQEEVFISI